MLQGTVWFVFKAMVKTSVGSTLTFVLAMKKNYSSDIIPVSIWHVYMSESLLLKKVHNESSTKPIVAGH